MSTNEISTPIQNTSASVLTNRIKMIINLIPNNFEGREIVVLSLQSKLDSIQNTTPEAMKYIWNGVSTILSTSLPDSENCAWSKQISELFGEPY